ncbi:heme utilization protein, partial [Giesbergeria sinuosa]
QIVALGSDQVKALTTGQIAALSSNQLRALQTQDFAALGTGQLAALNSVQAPGLTTGQFVTLDTAEISKLTTAFVRALTTATIKALATDQVSGLTTGQIKNLTTAQVASLSTGAIGALSPGQHAAMSTVGMTSIQTAAFTSMASPLVLDLNGDGVRTVAVAQGVQFALGTDGLLRQTGWVSSDDGLLVRDLNKDGSISDGRELFGTATELSPGVTAVDGFVALRALDSNGDGRISSEDAAFAELAVWKDTDGNGQTGAGELLSLQEAGVAALHLDAQASTQTDNGNLLGLVSSYETTDGTQRDLVDVWFSQGAVADDSLRSSVSGLTESLGSYLEGGSGSSATAALELPRRNGAAEELVGVVPQANPVSASSSLLTPLANYYQRSIASTGSGVDMGTNLVGSLSGPGMQQPSLLQALASTETLKGSK